ncbi:MAG: HAD family hydrolase [Candidatus Bipolaricaulota bacterium]
MTDQPPRRLSRFSHVLFDLDQTLATYALTTSDIVSVVWNRLAISPDEVGPPTELAARYDALWVRLERSASSGEALRRSIWSSVLRERGQTSPSLAERIAAEHGALRRSTGARLLEGVVELLSNLRGAGYGLGLLTNGLSDVQWEKIRALRVDVLVDQVSVAGDTGVYKPDPQAFRDLLSRLDAAAETSLFVGDSYEADVVGAIDCGMAAAWVRPSGTPVPGPHVPGFAVERATDLRSVLL